MALPADPPSTTVSAAPPVTDAEAVPHLERRGRAAYHSYLNSFDHKAFAIAPGGRWGWSAEEESAEAAVESAVARCQQHAPHRCVPYAIDQTVVFDEEEWRTLWRPSAAVMEGARATVGTAVGDLFPNLLLREGSGAPVTLSSFRGRVVLLHLWGSWCPACIGELAELQRLNRAIEAELSGEVELVLVQVRESFAHSSRWVVRNRLDGLPLYDSGSRSSEDQFLTLSTGEKIADRKIARVFPTSYVLDREGRVLFAHRGPVEEWLQYLPFLRDALSIVQP